MHLKNSAYLILLAGLAGCATLPSSGPTGGQIENSAAAVVNLPIQVVEVATSADIPQSQASSVQSTALPDLPPPPTDMIGPGDVLDISIYEAGVTLFAAGSSAVGATTVPGVQVQKLPPTRVNDAGFISIPYAGNLNVAGMTTGQVESMIRYSLRNISQNPQVAVTLTQAITNSVIVGGEIAKPGRVVLQTNRESLSDVIALAGGYRGNAKDLKLRVTRGTSSVDMRMNDLIDDPKFDVRAYPGDRLMLISNPQTYSVLGASGRVEQIAFSGSSVSLAEAIATAGGPNSGLGDPAAIFLFRYVHDEEGKEVPMVYHVNMMKAGSYLLSQRLAMRDKDVLYFGNAAANQPSKLIQLISQLFSPILTVTSVVQTTKNSNN